MLCGVMCCDELMNFVALSNDVACCVDLLAVYVESICCVVICGDGCVMLSMLGCSVLSCDGSF